MSTVPASETRPAAPPPRIGHDDLRLLIDGEWLKGEGRRTLPVINPATEEVLGQLPLATPADLDRALEAADPASRRGDPAVACRGNRAARDDGGGQDARRDPD